MKTKVVRPSACLSVCDVEVLRSHTLEFFESLCLEYSSLPVPCNCHAMQLAAKSVSGSGMASNHSNGSCQLGDRLLCVGNWYQVHSLVATLIDSRRTNTYLFFCFYFTKTSNMTSLPGCYSNFLFMTAAVLKIFIL